MRNALIQTDRPRGITPLDGACDPDAAGTTCATRGWDSPQFQAACLPLVLLATLVVYSPALSFQFVYDDIGQIVQNKLVQSWHYARFYPVMHVWAQASMSGNYYRPLFLFLLLIEHSLFGLHPMGWHAISILLHLGATLLVFALAREFLDRPSATVSATIFALHPVHIESVAWISGVTDPLLAVMIIPSLLCFIHFRKQGGYGWLCLSLMFYSAGLLCKETAIVVPGLIAAYDLVREPAKAMRIRLAGLVKDPFPWLAFAGVTLLYCGVRYRVLGTFSRSVTPLPWKAVVCTWPVALLQYARNSMFPFPLGLSYDIPYVRHPNFSNFWIPLASLGLIFAAMAWLFRRGSPATKFGIAVLVLPILPLLNLTLFPLNEVVHDRYLYVPSVGLALLVGAAWSELRTRTGSAHGPTQLRIAALLLLACALGSLTLLQSLPWANNLVLYADSVRRAPNVPVVHNNLGNELMDRGLYDAAIVQYRQALALLPSYWFSTYNLGYAYYKKSMYEQAGAFFGQALYLNPGDPDGWYYAGLTQQKLGRDEEAAKDFREAIRLMPPHQGYHAALAELLSSRGELEKARLEYEAELHNNPADGDARAKLARLRSAAP